MQFDSENNKLTSLVKCGPISLSIKQIGEIMHIPYVGSEVMTNYDQNWENYNKNDFYYSIIHFSKEDFHNKRRRMNGVVPKRVL